MHSLIVIVATYALYAVALGAAFAWLRAPRPDKVPFAVAGVVAAALVGILVKVAGTLWTDPRPFVVDHTTPLVSHNADNGFPSDHTALALAIALVVLARDQAIGVCLVVLALLLGAARVAAHVHHVPDILGGVVVALLAAAGGVLAGQLVERRLARRAETSADELVGRRTAA